MERNACMRFRASAHIGFATILSVKVSHMTESRIGGEGKEHGAGESVGTTKPCLNRDEHLRALITQQARAPALPAVLAVLIILLRSFEGARKTTEGTEPKEAPRKENHFIGALKARQDFAFRSSGSN